MGVSASLGKIIYTAFVRLRFSSPLGHGRFSGWQKRGLTCEHDILFRMDALQSPDLIALRVPAGPNLGLDVPHAQLARWTERRLDLRPYLPGDLVERFCGHGTADPRRPDGIDLGGKTPALGLYFEKPLLACLLTDILGWELVGSEIFAHPLSGELPLGELDFCVALNGHTGVVSTI